MPHNLFDRYSNVPSFSGSEITLVSNAAALYISDYGEVLCYAGAQIKNQPYSLHCLPYDLDGAHSFDLTAVERIAGYYRLIDGCVCLDTYPDSRSGTHIYKKLPVIVRLLSAGKPYGVYLDDAEDIVLTRTVFGLTYGELKQLLTAYAKVFGICNADVQYPELMKSKSHAHICDLMQLWIPQEYPYIAFEPRGYNFSSVSLFAFYRHLQLLTSCRTDSPAAKALCSAGLDASILVRVFSIGEQTHRLSKIKKDTAEKLGDIFRSDAKC